MTEKASPARDTDALLADMDALLAEVPAQAPPPEAAPQPEAEPQPAPAATGDSWEKITAPRPESARTRTMKRDGWQPRDLPEGLQPKVKAPPPAPAPEPAPALPASEEKRRADQEELIRLLRSAQQPPTAYVGVETAKDVEPDDQEAEVESGGEPDDIDTPPPTIPRSSRAQIIATTVGEWRLPARLGEKGILDLLLYNGLAVGISVALGLFRAAYETLRTLPANPDAVAGVAIAAALAYLLITRSLKGFIALGAAMVFVLLMQTLTLPVCIGLLGTLITWGVDQRARTVRQPIALIARMVWLSTTFALFALTWTAIVHAFTGATQ